MARSPFFFVIVILAAAAAVGLLLYAKKLRPREGPRPIWHYVLLWPILIEKNRRNDSTSGRTFTAREIAGWIIVLLLVVSAFVFNL
jgi:hypothetical protein